MGYLEQQQIEIAQQNLDAAFRLRSSQISMWGDYRFTHLDNSLYWNSADIGTGSGAIVGNAYRLSTTTTGDAHIKQTKMWHPYVSGKSQFFEFSLIGFNSQNGILKRVGYFDSSTVSPFTASLDGICLEAVAGTYYISIYNNGTTVTSIPRSSWDDPLDGTGDSGVNINWSNFNVFKVDFLWLGGTRVRFGLVINNEIVYFHTYKHSNTTAATMINKPNKPIRAEIISSSITSSSFDLVCCSVGSEGAVDDIGIIRALNTGTTGISVNVVGTYYALLGVGLKSGYHDISVFLENITTIITTTDNFIWEVRLNPTVAGVFTYSSITNSAIESAIGTIANTVTGGTVIHSGTSLNSIVMDRELRKTLRLGMGITGTRDKLVLCATPLTINSTAHASIEWRELI